MNTVGVVTASCGSNIAIGSGVTGTLSALTSGNGNTIIGGSGSGGTITTGTSNIVLGTTSYTNAPGGASINIVIGHNSVTGGGPAAVANVVIGHSCGTAWNGAIGEFGNLIIGNTIPGVAGEFDTVRIGTGSGVVGLDYNVTRASAWTFASAVTTNSGLYGTDAAALVHSLIALNNGAAASVGTLTNAPAAGNPTKWIPIDDHGTTRFIPAW